MVTLTLWPAFAGEEGIQVSLDCAERALSAYWGDGAGSGLARQGPDYYAAPRTPPLSDPDHIDFHDIAWAVLLSGQPRNYAAQALLRAGPVSIKGIPTMELATMGDDAVKIIAEWIWVTQRQLSGFATAMVTKTVHPKRPATVPVVDNENFFGTYQHPAWRPNLQPIRNCTARSVTELVGALSSIRKVVASPENQLAWSHLDAWRSPDGRGPLERIELFDMIWWVIRRHDSLGRDSGAA